MAHPNTAIHKHIRIQSMVTIAKANVISGLLQSPTVQSVVTLAVQGLKLSDVTIPKLGYTHTLPGIQQKSFIYIGIIIQQRTTMC